MRRRWISQAALISAVCVLLFADSAVREIHGTAVFYASMAREIADANNPLEIFTGPDAYLLKPPLQLWLTAAAIKLFGPTGFAASFFSRLFGIAVIVLSMLIARRLFGATTAWFTALVLATNSTFYQFTTMLRMESLLLTGILLTVLGALGRGPGRGGLAFYGGLALGIFAKGPAGLAPLLFLPAYAYALGRRWYGVIPRSYYVWLLVIPAIWFAYLAVAHGTAPISHLAADTMRGSSSGLLDHIASAVNSYVEKPLRRYWPWLPFMIGGIYLATRQVIAPRTRRRQKARSILLLSWIAAIVLFAALKPDHDVRYLYPALPPLAMAAAWCLVRLLGVRVPAWATASVIGIACLSIVVMLNPSLALSDPRPQLQQMRTLIDARLRSGDPVTIVGTQITADAGPRRQSEHRDWAHFYLGRDATLVRDSEADPESLGIQPLVFVARLPGQKSLAGDLGLRTVARTDEMLLTIPLAQQSPAR